MTPQTPGDAGMIRYTLIGVGVGIVLGVVLGAVIPPVGIGFGIGIGLFLGILGSVVTWFIRRPEA